MVDKSPDDFEFCWPVRVVHIDIEIFMVFDGELTINYSLQGFGYQLIVSSIFGAFSWTEFIA